MKKLAIFLCVIIIVILIGSLLGHGRPINTIGPWNEGPTEESTGQNNEGSKQNLPEPPKQPGQKQEPKPEESSPPVDSTPAQPTPVPQSRPVNQPPPSPITQE